MAGFIPEDFISEVRSSVNIVDVISQYVSLEKKGKDYLGLCPFHQEKTPSFTVNEENQFFKCFGCGKGGNVFKFLMYKDDLSFPESVEAVAKFAHIPMPTGYGNSDSVKKLNPLMRMHQDAAEFYHRVLMMMNAGKPGMEYARKRELSDEILNHFNVGYAPNQENLLLTFLSGKGYSNDDLAKSGLFVQSEDGKLFDRFRDRLMFPLGDESGRVIAFSGRRISNNKDEAKYMNSPETEIFTKSKVLFHFSEAKKSVREEKHLVLYEGYMDVIAAYKAGIKSGIASMGTSLTDQQIYMLRRITNNIIINYDGDDPGIHAEERAANLFEKTANFNLGIVVLPEKLDPDEYIKKYGSEKYHQEIAGALSSTEFFLKRLAVKYNLNNEREKVTYLDEAIKEIAKRMNPVEQDIYINRLAQEQNVSARALKANLVRENRRLRTANRHKNTNYANTVLREDRSVPEIVNKSVEKVDKVQQRLIYLFIHSQSAREYLINKKFLFPSDNYAQVAELWLQFVETHENYTISEFLDFIPEQLQSIIVSAEMTDMPKETSDEELEEQLNALRKRKINSKLDKLQKDLEDAKRKSDDDEILQLMGQILTLKRDLG
ncbi:DNA primase [Lactobacillus sp. PSON]|uniref:DNA primase n=1 Tax=Lactobacillus sp. PSON TaxID=3455454 RepID=UPI00404250FD